MKILSITFVLSIILIGGILAENIQPPVQDCNSIKSDLVILNQTYNDTLSQLNIYQNLTDYYKTLYENTNVSVSNLQLINLNENVQILNQNITNLNEKVNNLEVNITIFEVSFSLISISVLCATIWEIVTNRRKRKNAKVE